MLVYVKAEKEERGKKELMGQTENKWENDTFVPTYINMY
jgi:hypothetical protein